MILNFSRLLWIVFAAFSFSKGVFAKDADDYNANNLPVLPEWFGPYQIDLESISPDQNWAVLIPKDIQTGGNYLVHLPDFTPVLNLPTIGIFADKTKDNGLVVHWAQDSSTAVMYTSGKLGVEQVFIVVPGGPGYIIDLDHEIRRQMQADFVASKAQSWNGNFDYFLEEGDAEGVWTINKMGQVIVDCEGDDNPRIHSGLSWKGHFQGLYDIQAEKFVTKKYHRDFLGNYDQQ